MTIHEAAEKYQNDPTFHAVVSAMRGMIWEMHVSPAEMRDAAMYAAYLVELERPPAPIVIPNTENQ